MHSYFSRLNSIFAFSLSVLGALAFAVYLSTALRDYSSAPIEIRVTKALVKRAPDYTVGPEVSACGNISNVSAVFHLFISAFSLAIFGVGRPCGSFS